MPEITAPPTETPSVPKSRAKSKAKAKKKRASRAPSVLDAVRPQLGRILLPLFVQVCGEAGADSQQAAVVAMQTFFKENSPHLEGKIVSASSIRNWMTVCGITFERKTVISYPHSPAPTPEPADPTELPPGDPPAEIGGDPSVAVEGEDADPLGRPVVVSEDGIEGEPDFFAAAGGPTC